MKFGEICGHGNGNGHEWIDLGNGIDREEKWVHKKEQILKSWNVRKLFATLVGKVIVRLWKQCQQLAIFFLYF